MKKSEEKKVRADLKMVADYHRVRDKVVKKMVKDDKMNDLVLSGEPTYDIIEKIADEAIFRMWQELTKGEKK